MRWKIAAFAVMAAGLSGCVPVKPAVNTDFGASIAKAISHRCVNIGPGFIGPNRNGYPLAIPLGDGNPATNTMYGNTPQILQLLDALVDAGLLSRKDAQVANPMVPSQQVPGRIYATTDNGRAYLTAPGSFNFCLAHVAFDRVVDFTVPGVDAQGETVSRVTFNYKLVDEAPWVHTPAIENLNYLTTKAILSHSTLTSSAKATLMNDGWEAEITGIVL